MTRETYSIYVNQQIFVNVTRDLCLECCGETVTCEGVS